MRQHLILRQESLGVIVPASSAERTGCTGRHLYIQTKPLSHRVGHIPEQYRKSAGFAALGRPGLSCRKHDWTAPAELTAVQPSPWLYRESTAPLETTQETKRERRAHPNTAKKEATKQDKDVTKQTNSTREQVKQIKKEGGR